METETRPQSPTLWAAVSLSSIHSFTPEGPVPACSASAGSKISKRENAAPWLGACVDIFLPFPKQYGYLHIYNIDCYVPRVEITWSVQEDVCWLHANTRVFYPRDWSIHSLGTGRDGLRSSGIILRRLQRSDPRWLNDPIADPHSQQTLLCPNVISIQWAAPKTCSLSPSSWLANFTKSCLLGQLSVIICIFPYPFN